MEFYAQPCVQPTRLWRERVGAKFANLGYTEIVLKSQNRRAANAPVGLLIRRISGETFMPKQNSPHYLQVLEQLLSERRALKEQLELEYQQIEDALLATEKQLEFVEAEYAPLGNVLEPLRDERDELNRAIRERKNRVKKLEKELQKLQVEIEQFENEVKPMRDEISQLMKRTKPHRDRIRDLSWRMYELQEQQNEIKKQLKRARRDFSEIERQYWLALQWEKRKPIIIGLGLVFLFVVILVSFVWAATQLPLSSLLSVLTITFLIFLVVVLTILRQDEKLREESFVDLIRDIFKQLRLLRQ